MVSCDKCPRRLECVKLSVCLDLLNNVHDAVVDEDSYNEIKEFKEKIDETGYSFPTGQVFCRLASSGEGLEPYYRKAKKLFLKATKRMAYGTEVNRSRKAD